MAGFSRTPGPEKYSGTGFDRQETQPPTPETKILVNMLQGNFGQSLKQHSQPETPSLPEGFVMGEMGIPVPASFFFAQGQQQALSSFY